MEKVISYRLPLCNYLKTVNSDLTAACNYVQNVLVLLVIFVKILIQILKQYR